MDSSAINLEDQRSSVLEVLQQIGVAEEKLQNMIEVWNKIDLREEQIDGDGSLKGAEDDSGLTETEDDVESASFTEESTDEDDTVTEPSSGESRVNVDEEENYLSDDWDAVDGHQGYSEEWNVCNDQPDYSSKGLKTEDDSQGELSGNSKNVNLHFQDVRPVETSAVMGVGLQELLSLVDEKLNKQHIMERKDFGNFNRKWRPPNNSNAATAVEQ